MEFEYIINKEMKITDDGKFYHIKIIGKIFDDDGIHRFQWYEAAQQ